MEGSWHESRVPLLAGRDPVLLRIDPAASRFVNTEWLQFPLQSLGTRSDPQSVTVTNNTAGARRVSFAPSANLEVQGCPVLLAPGESCLLQVTHLPRTTTALPTFSDFARASLSIVDDGGRQATVQVYGDVEKSLVVHFYRRILRREPDLNGWFYWGSQARSLDWNINAFAGTIFNNPAEAWNAMAMAFFGSAEYAARASDDDAYLVDLYQTFFDRAPDAGGLAFWKEQLGQGLPREMILTAFMFSSEFTEINSRYFGGAAVRPEIDVVLDMYRGILARLPDMNPLPGGPSGFRYWVLRLQAAQCQGEAAVRAEVAGMSSLFATSAEYAARSRSNALYVADLYNAFLRRSGDPTGFQNWKSALDTGSLTREEVRRAFVASAEFAARVQRVLQASCRPPPP
jgi:hypothetical protein